jgi:hypothetical protein
VTAHTRPFPERARRPLDEAPRTHAATALLALAMLGTVVVVYRLGHGLTFHGEQWDDLVNRRGWGAGTFLAPHSGALSLVPVALFKLARAVGRGDYGVYRALLLIVHCACVALVFVLLRRRVDPLFALAGALAVLLLGGAWPELIAPERIGYLLGIAFGLGSLLALDHRRDLLVAVLLAGALASSTVGLAFAVIPLVEGALGRGPATRYWVAVAPLALYAVWALEYGNPATAGTSVGTVTLMNANFPRVPTYVADAAAAAVGALTGLAVEWGRPLAVVAAVAVGVRLSRVAPLTARLLALLVAAGAYWAALGLFRGQSITATDARYVYFGAVVVVLVAGEMFAGADAGGRSLAVLAGILAVAAVAGYGVVRDAATSLRAASGPSGWVASSAATSVLMPSAGRRPAGCAEAGGRRNAGCRPSRVSAMLLRNSQTVAGPTNEARARLTRNRTGNSCTSRPSRRALSRSSASVNQSSVRSSSCSYAWRVIAFGRPLTSHRPRVRNSSRKSALKQSDTTARTHPSSRKSRRPFTIGALAVRSRRYASSAYSTGT